MDIVKLLSIAISIEKRQQKKTAVNMRKLCFLSEQLESMQNQVNLMKNRST